jgi:hypothetical protein
MFKSVVDLCFAVGLMAVSVIVFRQLLRGLRLGRASACWSRTEGHIVRVWVDERTGGEGETTYYPHIEFRYEVGGEVYDGKEWTHHGLVGTWENATAVCDRFPAGRKVDVFYDPADPVRAVLEQGVEVKTYVIGMAIAAGIGVAGILLMLHSAWTILGSARG